MEKTFVMIKPDGTYRRLVGEVITRIERKGLKIIGLKQIQIEREQAQKLYQVHEKKPFYDGLMKFVMSGPIVVMVVEGYNAVTVLRKTAGATFGYDAECGTIRGDFSTSRGKNIVHCSDSIENAQREAAIFFTPNEFLSYEMPDDKWITEKDER